MTLANREAGIVVGTGDLSEKALGWSTYAGDHIAMYDVNAGVPKTLIHFVIRWVANERARDLVAATPDALREVLFAILDTPISPELLPADAEGAIAQLTEEHHRPLRAARLLPLPLRPPRRAARAASSIWRGSRSRERYDLATLKKWLRAVLPALLHQPVQAELHRGRAEGRAWWRSRPRGDWRMPSDAQVRSWLSEVDSYSSS